MFSERSQSPRVKCWVALHTGGPCHQSTERSMAVSGVGSYRECVNGDRSSVLRDGGSSGLEGGSAAYYACT